MESAIEGYRAGKSAEEYASKNSRIDINKSQVLKLGERLYSPVSKTRGINYRELKGDFIYISKRLGALRDEESLMDLLSTIDKLKREKISNLYAKDFHELAMTMGTENRLLCLEMLVRCALYRKESRGAHARKDYPERNDEEWRKWIILKNVNDEIKLRTEDIPYEMDIKVKNT